MKLRAEDLGALARGAAVLGTGGGGDPHIGRLLAQEALREHGPVEIVAVGDRPDDAYCEAYRRGIPFPLDG